MRVHVQGYEYMCLCVCARVWLEVRVFVCARGRVGLYVFVCTCAGMRVQVFVWVNMSLMTSH